MGTLINKVTPDSAYWWPKTQKSKFWNSRFPKRHVRVAISQKDVVEFPKKLWWVNQCQNCVRPMWSDLMVTFSTPSRLLCRVLSCYVRWQPCAKKLKFCWIHCLESSLMLYMKEIYANYSNVVDRIDLNQSHNQSHNLHLAYWSGWNRTEWL